MTAQQVRQGRLQSPFNSRLVALDTINSWHEWKGYTTPDELYCAETEYFAIRNATGVFDLTPMTKYRITGPDALAYLDRLVTRDMKKIRPDASLTRSGAMTRDRSSTTARSFISATANTACVRRNATMRGCWTRRSVST